MMIKKIHLLLLFIFSISPLFSQTKDFGIWYGAGVKYGPIKKVDINIAACTRTASNATHVEQFYLDGGINYKFNKIISISGNYRFIIKDEDWNNYHNRYRLYSDLKLQTPSLKNFRLSLRSRFQCQYKQYIEDAEDKLPQYYCRIKTQLYYNWPFCPVNPYIAAEWFYPLKYDITRSVDQKRFSAGLQYKITKKHTLEGEFLYQREYLPKLKDMGIVSVNYEFEF